MKTMSKKEEIILVQEMIGQTQRALQTGRRDRLQLEAELHALEAELTELLFPELKPRIHKTKAL